MKGASTQTTGELMTMRSLPTGSAAEESSALSAGILVSPHSLDSVGRLQMANNFHHQPVLLSEVIDLFRDVPSGTVVDATLGGAGHAVEILETYPSMDILGIDRDEVARLAARSKLEHFGSRAAVVAGQFGNLPEILDAQRSRVGEFEVVGVLLDLGVSSTQLDDASRGFSFRADAPLDMRMDHTSGVTAADLIASMPENELAKLLHHHGETRFARSIARSIKSRSPKTTLELVDAVEAAVPMAARRRGNVATRVFQALRVEVNDEEGELQRVLAAAFSALVVGGVLVVISYHSGEDRAVKSFLHDQSTGGCVCPADLGCVCGAVPTMRILKASAVLAGPDEVTTNPRARSARLRAGWKLAT